MIRGKSDALLPSDLWEGSDGCILGCLRREPVVHELLLFPPLNNPQDPFSLVLLDEERDNMMKY